VTRKTTHDECVCIACLSGVGGVFTLQDVSTIR